MGDPAGLGMKEARHAFLASAGVALDQDGGIAAGHAAGQCHQAGAGGIANGRDRSRAGQLGDQREGKTHVFEAKGDAGGQAIGRRHQRRLAVDQVDEDIAMGGMADLGREKDAAAIPLTRALRIHDPHRVQGIFEPVLQARNERADPTAHVKR